MVEPKRVALFTVPVQGGLATTEHAIPIELYHIISVAGNPDSPPSSTPLPSPLI